MHKQQQNHRIYTFNHLQLGNCHLQLENFRMTTGMGRETVLGMLHMYLCTADMACGAHTHTGDKNEH